MANKYIKKNSPLLVISEMQIKIPWYVITYPLEMADFLKQLKIPHVSDDTEK